MPGDEPEMTDAPAEEASEPQGYCIEICVMADGSIKVAGPSDLDGDEQDGQDAGSIGEALKLALTIYKGASGGAGPTGADDQMAAGFNAVRPNVSGA
jgi:hypothetical protein